MKDSIFIQNIYYMLSYAYKVLREGGYRKLCFEEFENAVDLLSAILVKAVSVQIKRGLHREYLEKTEQIGCVHGKIDINESIKTMSLMKKQLVCTFDDFSINSYMNRIIKTTMLILLKSDIRKSIRKDIKNLLLYFKDVDTLEIGDINWKLRYDRNNKSYEMIINICYLIIKGLVQNEKDGNMKIMHFLDEQSMCRLYEKFLFEYFRKEYPEIRVSSPYINWDIIGEADSMLPVMHADIVLEYEGKKLIIDAKYYKNSVQRWFDKPTIHSSNLYQIYAYVKNMASRYDGEVSGLLLYAMTNEKVVPDNEYVMGGNRIGAKSLDLGVRFEEIEIQLNDIVRNNFNQMCK